MNKKQGLFVFVMIVVGLVILTNFHSRKTFNIDIQNRPYKIGITGYFPINFPNSTVDQINDYYKQINNYAEVYGVSTNIDSTNIIDAAATQQKKEILLVLGIGNESSWLDNKDKFISVVEQYLVKYPQITYLSIGNEVNIHFNNDDNFKNFIEAYNYIYSSLKKDFSNLKIFTTFQFETLIGKSYLTGVENGNSQFELFTQIEPNLDLIGLTLYPYFNYTSPNSIPSDYLSILSQYSNKKLAITETGWPSGQVGNQQNDYSGTQQEQRDYLRRLAILLKDRNIEFVNWLGFYDISVDNTDVFNSLGLKGLDTSKIAFDDWLELLSITK